MTIDELRALPPDDPRRAEWVLSYLNTNAAFGLGTFEMETIKACLQDASAQIVRPENPDTDFVAGIIKAAGILDGIEKRHAELCVSQVAAGVACAFGSDNLAPDAIAARAAAIFGHIRTELAGPVK